MNELFIKGLVDAVENAAKVYGKEVAFDDEISMVCVDRLDRAKADLMYAIHEVSLAADSNNANRKAAHDLMIAAIEKRDAIISELEKKLSYLESAIRVKGQEVDFWKKYALQANNLMIELKRIADKEGNIRNDQKPI